MHIRSLLLLLLPLPAFAQPQPVTMETAVEIALQQNKGLQSAGAQVDYYRSYARTAGEIAKTEVALQHGQYNSYVKEDNNISITQSLPFPTVFGARKQLNGAQVKRAEWLKASTQNELVYQVKQVYVQLLYLKEQEQLLQRQDSLYGNFARSADLRYRTGETALLPKAAAEARLNEVRNTLRQNRADRDIYLARLQSLMGLSTAVAPAEDRIPAVTMPFSADSSAVANNPYLQYLQQQVAVTEGQKRVYSSSILPDITLGYFNQSLIGTPLDAGGAQLAKAGNRFQGFQVGLALPLWWGPLQAKVKAEERQRQAAALSYEQNRVDLQSRYRQAVSQYMKQQHNLDYFIATALPNASLILTQSQLAYSKGEIGYAEHLLNLEQALGIQQGYLQARHDVQQAALYMEYLAGGQTKK